MKDFTERNRLSRYWTSWWVNTFQPTRLFSLSSCSPNLRALKIKFYFIVLCLCTIMYHQAFGTIHPDFDWKAVPMRSGRISCQVWEMDVEPSWNWILPTMMSHLGYVMTSLRLPTERNFRKFLVTNDITRFPSVRSGQAWIGQNTQDPDSYPIYTWDWPLYHLTRLWKITPSLSGINIVFSGSEFDPLTSCRILIFEALFRFWTSGHMPMWFALTTELPHQVFKAAHLHTALNPQTFQQKTILYDKEGTWAKSTLPVMSEKFLCRKRDFLVRVHLIGVHSLATTTL